MPKRRGYVAVRANSTRGAFVVERAAQDWKQSNAEFYGPFARCADAEYIAREANAAEARGERFGLDDVQYCLA